MTRATKLPLPVRRERARVRVKSQIANRNSQIPNDQKSKIKNEIPYTHAMNRAKW
jgi:hypothetical protein